MTAIPCIPPRNQPRTRLAYPRPRSRYDSHRPSIHPFPVVEEGKRDGRGFARGLGWRIKSCNMDDSCESVCNDPQRSCLDCYLYREVDQIIE
jgi:hypothetical protein